jgi:hypothetical protein
MKTNRTYFILLFIGALYLLPSPVSAQFITIARKIKTMHTGHADIATVIIEAGTFRVYQAVTDTLTANPKFRITSRSKADNSVEFSIKTYTVSMKVDSLANNLAQITVSSSPSGGSEKSATNMAVESIMGVCEKMGIKCTVDKK